MKLNRLSVRSLNCDVTLEIVERFSVNPSQRQNFTSFSFFSIFDAHSITAVFFMVLKRSVVLTIRNGIEYCAIVYIVEVVFHKLL